jgi:hypothetical protein
MSEAPTPLIDLADVDLTPRFVERLANASDHGAYLEAAHESTHRNLAIIQLRMARGDYDGATDLMKQLRDHLDTLWDQFKDAADKGVRP